MVTNNYSFLDVLISPLFQRHWCLQQHKYSKALRCHILSTWGDNNRKPLFFLTYIHIYKYIQTFKFQCSLNFLYWRPTPFPNYSCFHLHFPIHKKTSPKPTCNRKKNQPLNHAGSSLVTYSRIDLFHPVTYKIHSPQVK